MRIERKPRRRLQMNIAPLVDVVFLLLLFFMVSSRIVSEPAIKLSLPESKTATEHRGKDIVVTVTGEGFIYVQEKLVRLGEIQSAIRTRLDSAGDVPVRIKADKEATLGLLVKVVDEVKLAGVSDFFIVTERK